MTIHLYAEHLLNIRTLSIQASLSTVSNQETQVSLSADGNTLTLNHERESASVQLPINLSPNKQSNAKLIVPPVPNKYLSFRVQVEEKESSDSLLGNGDANENGNVAPWIATSLTTSTSIRCRYCGSVLIERGSIRMWKDLPSEGWAEMMEFWHCHKPDDPTGHDHAGSKKGYAADSQLAVESGVGLVDAINFLFVAEDCKNMRVGSTSSLF